LILSDERAQCSKCQLLPTREKITPRLHSVVLNTKTQRPLWGQRFVRYKRRRNLSLSGCAELFLRSTYPLIIVAARLSVDPTTTIIPHANHGNQGGAATSFSTIRNDGVRPAALRAKGITNSIWGHRVTTRRADRHGAPDRPGRDFITDRWSENLEY
jgi:hypothetical protein